MPAKKIGKRTVGKRSPSKKPGSVAAVLEPLQKRFGKGLIATLSESRITAPLCGWSWGVPSVNYICTGNPALGVVRGKIYEIFGDESSGKTTLCLQAIADCQRRGGIAAFIDVEHALDLRYAARLGVVVGGDSDKPPFPLLFSQPDYGEQAQELVDDLMSRGADLVVVDSVAALTPLAVLEGRLDKTQIGGQARLMSQSLSLISKSVSRGNGALIFTNQTRTKIGQLFGNPETTSGGKALKFYASVRLRCMISTAVKKLIRGSHATLTGKRDRKKLGSEGEIKCVKNKIFRPFLETTVPLFYGAGFDGLLDLFLLAERAGLIGREERDEGSFLVNGKVVTHEKLSDASQEVWDLITSVDMSELSGLEGEEEIEEENEGEEK